MKKLTLIAASLVAALNTYAQGTVVFDNFGGGLVNNAFRGGDVSTADGIVVQLYASMTGAQGSFQPVPGSVVQVGVLADGFYSITDSVTIPASIIGTAAPTLPGPGAFLEVRAWETAYGSSFEQAVGAPAMGGRVALRGISPSFMVVSTGNPAAQPPGLPTLLSDLTPGFSVNVPEPSVIALGVIGAGALLLLRRRK
jgi:hypothetical protein